MPDRIVLLPGGRIIFEELQSPTCAKSFSVADLYELTNDDLDKAEIGKIAKFTGDGTKTFITGITRNHDIVGDMQITLATKAVDVASTIADLADRQRIEQVYSQGATGVITFVSKDGADVTVAADNFISSRPWKSGICDTVKTPSGSPVSNTNAKYPCVYRGIENPWGNQYRWRWDFLKNDAQPYVLDAPENYTGAVNDHYTALSYQVPITNGYATEMGFDPAFPYARVTKAIGGGSTTYFADYYYFAAGLRALLVGGIVYNGRYAGARYCRVYNSPSAANWYFGAALSPA